MEIPFVSGPVFLLCLLCAGFVQSEDAVRAFVHDVKDNLGHSIFHKLYQLNYDSVDQFRQAFGKGGAAFASIIDTAEPQDLAKKLLDRSPKIAKFDRHQFFYVFAEALARTLVDHGALTSDNAEDIAHTYVTELRTSASLLEGDNVMETVPAVIEATAYVVKRLGLTGQQQVENDFSKHLLQQIKMQD